MLPKLLAVALLAASSLVAQHNPTDDRIYDQVRLKLAGDPIVGRGNIDVEVHDGAVKLKGKVHNEKQKQKAAKLASKVKGVTNVVNELRVEP